MTDDQVWDDQARTYLREQIRDAVLGQLRLARLGHERIIQDCNDRILEKCPEQEQQEFREFAASELDRTAAQLAAEMGDWPEVTDCDRLDHVEQVLRERGILLWQVSPCCDTCTCGEILDRVEAIDRRYPGFQNSVRGFAFFIEQNMPESLTKNCDLELYLGYGWLSFDDSDVSRQEYEANALGIAREVCQCLQAEGFEVDWNGSFSRKFGISVNWQRRTLLE